jgi:CDP-4-dehydro-6-deoxyglucose reductase, E1
MRWPLMNNNIVEEDMDVLVKFLSQRPIPILTNGSKVREFEEEWSKWLGVKYSIFVNSGSSANILTLLAIKEMCGVGEVIVSPLGWVSDIAAIMHTGMTPVFCDINLKNLALDENEVIKKITPNTKAIVLVHILGYNGLSDKLIEICEKNNIILIEDVCESHGATFKGHKLGTFGHVSNFSFYYAHHMTSIEGGMICTDDAFLYNMLRSYRSHAMAREMDDENIKAQIVESNPLLNKDFIFIAPSYNMRSTEINAVMALNQLKRLDENNIKRKRNLDVFLDNLDKSKYYGDFDREGNSNYAFTLLLRHPDFQKRNIVETTLSQHGIEFRRGMSGGGNQLCQPYLKRVFGDEHIKYPVCNFVHNYGWYIGNYPDLEEYKICELTKILNDI